MKGRRDSGESRWAGRLQGSRDFQEKYDGFFKELNKIPKKAMGKRGTLTVRQEWLKQHPQKDEFIMDALKAYSPYTYQAMRKRLEIGGYEDGAGTEPIDGREDGSWPETEPIGRDEDGYGAEPSGGYVNASGLDGGLAGTPFNRHFSKEKSQLAFMEAIHKAVENYTAVEKGIEEYEEHELFLCQLGRIYNQEIGDEARKTDGVKVRLALVRLVRKVLDPDDTDERMAKFPGLNPNCSDEELGEKLYAVLKAGGKAKYSKNDIREAIRVVRAVNMVSLDKRVGEEEEGGTLGDLHADPKDPYAGIWSREENDVLLNRLIEYLPEVAKAIGVRNLEYVRAILTRGFLWELKMDHRSGEKPRPFDCYPAGDKAFYEMLAPRGEELYQKIFFRRYVDRAIEDRPEDLAILYGVYYNYLREDFNNSFTDEQLAETLGRNKSTVSRVEKSRKESLPALKALLLRDEMTE